MQRVVAIAKRDAAGETEGPRIVILAPKLGIFERSIGLRDIASPSRVLGVLDVLNARLLVVAPHDVWGEVVDIDAALRRPVGYSDPLMTLTSRVAGTADASAARPRDNDVIEGGGCVVAPTHGVFYARPSPDLPPYVETGQILSRGEPIGLIEVMKSFSPVVYDGDALPARAKVVEILVRDREEVLAGRALVRVTGLGT